MSGALLQLSACPRRQQSAWHVVDVRGIFAASFIPSNVIAQICVKLLELEPWRERMRAQVPVYLLQREQTADTQISSMSGGDMC